MTTSTDTEDDPRTSAMRWLRWVALAVAIAAMTVGAILGTGLGKDPTLVDTPLVGKPAPEATPPYLEHDGTLDMKSLRGRIVVVNFWASWCVPCREEHPTLTVTADTYSDSGVTFVGINYQDQRDAARSASSTNSAAPRTTSTSATPAPAPPWTSASSASRKPSSSTAPAPSPSKSADRSTRHCLPACSTTCKPGGNPSLHLRLRPTRPRLMTADRPQATVNSR